MSIIKETEIAKIEVVGGWNIQIATETVVKEDNNEIARSRIRSVLQPCSSSAKDADGKWTHTDTDISSEATEVQAVCNAVWTSDILAKYKSFVESQEV